MYMLKFNSKALRAGLTGATVFSAVLAHGQLAANAYSFLDVSSSTHALALGGYGIAVSSPDPMLADQNPALLGPEIGRVAALSYMRYFGSSNFAAARFAHSAGERGGGGVGFGGRGGV